MGRYLSDGAQRYHRSCSPPYPFVTFRSPAASCDHDSPCPSFPLRAKKFSLATTRQLMSDNYLPPRRSMLHRTFFWSKSRMSIQPFGKGCNSWKVWACSDRRSMVDPSLRPERSILWSHRQSTKAEDTHDAVLRPDRVDGARVFAERRADVPPPHDVVGRISPVRETTWGHHAAASAPGRDRASRARPSRDANVQSCRRRRFFDVLDCGPGASDRSRRRWGRRRWWRRRSGGRGSEDGSVPR